MRVTEIMTADVETIAPMATIREAANKMKERNIGALPVSENGQVIGMVTDRDLVLRTIAAGRSPSKTKVKDVMTHDIVYCFADQTVDEACSLMTEHHIRRLAIFNRDRALVGVLSLEDIAIKTDEKLGGRVLKQVAGTA